MKIKSLAFSLAILLLGCGDRNVVQKLDTQSFLNSLNQSNTLIIDVRDDSFYNGFKESGASKGGHIKGAIQFSTSWLDYMDMNELERFATQKGITKDKTLIFYGSNEGDLEHVGAEFASRGYKVKTFDRFNEVANANYPLESFPNYTYSISPLWLKELMSGGKPESYEGKPYMIFEVSWGELKDAKDYATHIKGAYHFNTDWIENAPVWNLSSPEVIEANLLKNGITSEKTIILYSSNQLAAYRVFLALKRAGVKDVRVLNGNLDTWIDNGGEVEREVNLPKSERKFGAKMAKEVEFIIPMPKDLIAEQKKGLKLVSNRAWEEYIGEISGYSYIPRAGEPVGAIYGFAGTDSSNMADYYDPDGTLRNPLEIFELWKSQGINSDDYVAFYCGTGWRAGVSWFMTQMAGWSRAKVYDGGWNAWQMDESLPVQKGAPKGMSKPDAKNDFGKVFKKGQSCKD